MMYPGELSDFYASVVHRAVSLLQMHDDQRLVTFKMDRSGYRQDQFRAKLLWSPGKRPVIEIHDLETGRLMCRTKESNPEVADESTCWWLIKGM